MQSVETVGKFDAQLKLIDNSDKKKNVLNKSYLSDNIYSVIKKTLAADCLVIFIRDKISNFRIAMVFDKDAKKVSNGRI